jgi:predicted DNA binding protein
MRYVRIVLIPEGPGFHPAAEELATEPAVSQETVHHLNLLNDGTAVSLSRARGERDRLAGIFEASDDVLSFELSEMGGEIQTYVHFRPSEPARAMLELTREHELVVDTPIEFEGDGRLRVAVIGEDDVVQRAITEIPDEVDIELERLSDYEPELRELSSLLTERQQEILDTAVEVGYYQVPREATHEDIADELDIATTTVGEHLRKIEARLLSELSNVQSENRLPR